MPYVLSQAPETTTTVAPTAAISNLLSVASSATQNTLTIRSQITPDIVIDLNKLVSSDPSVPANEAVQSQSSTLMNWIRPELIVNAVGIQKTIAPYGEPTQDLTVYVGAAVVGILALGAFLAFSVCRKI